VTSRSGDAGEGLVRVEFLVRGARGFAEAGDLLSFEESDAELAMNVVVEQIRDQAEITLRWFRELNDDILHLWSSPEWEQVERPAAVVHHGVTANRPDGAFRHGIRRIGIG
jgi:hypothetical protein